MRIDFDAISDEELEKVVMRQIVAQPGLLFAHFDPAVQRNAKSGDQAKASTKFVKIMGRTLATIASSHTYRTLFYKKGFEKLTNEDVQQSEQMATKLVARSIVAASKHIK